MQPKSIYFILLFLLSISITLPAQEVIPEPEKFFGFVPGSDRNLFNCEKMINYPEIVDRGSERKQRMGLTGTRYFVPPNRDPIAIYVEEGLWNWTGIFGAGLMKDMTGEDLTGISRYYLFDDYRPGSAETRIWKGEQTYLNLDEKSEGQMVLMGFNPQFLLFCTYSLQIIV